ncbi:MAG: hypothetical protein AAF798_11155, partial [Bacteroidota bacterium]
LSAYLDTEEEEDYMRLKESFEPRIALLYNDVARKNPLQIIAFETVLLDQLFEGLYLPKILGYSVLRGEVHPQRMKYVRPQDHFKDVLLAICNSANFDILRKRIGQSIQMGFALSSDIWVTNLINSIDNKRVRYFLQGQKLDRYRNDKERKIGYDRYARQFRNEIFQTAEFPTDVTGLKVFFSPLKNFLSYRISSKLDNTSIIPAIKDFIGNEAFYSEKGHLQILALYANFFELEREHQAHLAKHFNAARKTMPQFDEHYMDFLLELHESTTIEMTIDADLRASTIVDDKIADSLTPYYQLVYDIHTKGYTNEDVQDAIRVFYTSNEGLSTINENVRKTILGYFERYINNLEVTAYADYFELTKLFPPYMSIFANQQFNQHLKNLSMSYVKKLLKKYTDKRGKDYQDIKKFVSTVFQDFGFLKEKEIVELFKTKRKRKKVE